MIRELLGLVFKSKRKATYYYKLIRYFHKNILADLFRWLYQGKPITNINLFEQRYYSQNGEDGILRIIFDKIGTTNRHCVEFGIHNQEGNTIYLEKQKWHCLWMDGNGGNDSIKKEFITAENINTLFQKYNIPREFDLLSIDIDSNDYWIWKALEGYSPRVVAIEYNATIPPTESSTVPYNPSAQWDGTNYYGASLLALYNLGAEKGYTLVGCDKMGINAFFVRNELIGNNFQIKPIQRLYKPPGYGTKINGKRSGHRESKQLMVEV